jgi:putative transposase
MFGLFLSMSGHRETNRTLPEGRNWPAAAAQCTYADGAYGGVCARDLEQRHHISVEVVRRPGNGTTGTLHNAAQGTAPAAEINKGFVALPKRWVVERTHAWTERWRRTVMHHDRKLDISAAWVWLAEARMLLNRLTYRG